MELPLERLLRSSRSVSTLPTCHHSAESTELDMELPLERLLRSSRSVSTLPTCHHSAERTALRDKLSASGNANIPTKRLPVVLINSPPLPPSPPKLPFKDLED